MSTKLHDIPNNAQISAAFTPRALTTTTNSSAQDFAAGDHRATFDIRTGSALNPLTLPALREFRCPKEL